MQILPLLGPRIISRKCGSSSSAAAASSSLANSISSSTIIVPRTDYRRRRNYSSSNKRAHGDRLRVAVVGGGAVGLSTALHLAPLVNAGYIGAPIDVFDHGGKPASSIGVGLWSTALYGFRDNGVESHKIAYRSMVSAGSFSEKVGFRSPRGDWLAGSNLDGDKTPDFLFLRESDVMDSLRKGIHHEVQKGTVVLHEQTRVQSIVEDCKEPWSAPLTIAKNGSTEATERDYHLIVAADGMNSVLRKTYGGHDVVDRRRFLGTDAMEKISDGPNLDLSGPNNNADHEHENCPVARNHAEAIGTQDRHYHVFRGNSPLTKHDVEGLEEAFQTWGESHNMRFATVPMECPSDNGKTEYHTWFITIDDPTISSESNRQKRKELLLEAFSDWHDPIAQLVEATPADEILMDRAVAHKHSCEPVVNFSDVVCKIRKQPSLPSSVHGNGPVIQFVGDSFMTVDPILAQGFTFGMEGAAALADSLSKCLSTTATSTNSNLAFDPYALRTALLDRHDQRLNRLLCLLRSSELVQALGQPTEGSFSGWISRCVLRPAMRLTPDFVKTPIFNRVMEYSLGLVSKKS